MPRAPRFLLPSGSGPESFPPVTRSSDLSKPHDTEQAADNRALAADGISRLRLGPEESHHLRKVLRLKPGDEVEVFDPETRISRFGKVLSSDASTVEIAVEREVPPQVEPYRIHLVVGLVSSDNCDLIVEKCTEIGVSSLSFFGAERSQYHLRGEKAEARLRRWRRLVEAAVKQSYAPMLPRVDLSGGLDDTLRRLHPGGEIRENRILLLPPQVDGGLSTVQVIQIAKVFSGPSRSEPSHAAPLQNLQEMVDSYIIVGPEGGLTGSEVNLAIGRGYTACSISSNVLRTETAAILASGIVQAFLRASR